MWTKIFMGHASPMSRRAVLGAGGVIGITGFALAVPASAQQKVGKVDAKYQDQPKGQQRCEICLQFQPPDTCKLVAGPIKPKGWCQFFAAKEGAH